MDTVGPPEKYQVRLYTVYSENSRDFPLFYINMLTRTKTFWSFKCPKRGIHLYINVESV